MLPITVFYFKCLRKPFKLLNACAVIRNIFTDRKEQRLILWLKTCISVCTETEIETPVSSGKQWECDLCEYA